MAITQSERELMQQMTAEGASLEEVKAAVAKTRALDPQWNAVTRTQQADQMVPSRISETVGDVVETGQAMFNTAKTRVGNMSESVRATSFRPEDWAPGTGKQSPFESALQVGSQAFLGGLDLAFDVGIGGAKVLLEESDENKVQKEVEEIATSLAQIPYVQDTMEWSSQLSDRSKRNFAIPQAALELLGFKLTGDALARVRNAARGMRSSGVVDDVPVATYTVDPDGTVRRTMPIEELPGDVTAEAAPGAGVSQMASELAQRPARAVRRANEAIREAAERRDFIANSSPEVGNAINEGVDKNLAAFVASADAPTAREMREVLDIAENGTRGQNVMEVPSRSVTEQYDLLNNRRKEIGQELGQAIKNLPDATVDMRPAYGQVDALLREQLGVTTNLNGTFNFANSALTPEQRDLLTKAYTLLREAGDTPSAEVVHAKDSLFSRLNREAYRDGIQPIMVTDETGKTVNLLEVLRDVYRSPLDTMSNGEIRRINTEYAKYRNIVDQAENTIFKIAKTTGVAVDPEEKATRLLRRIDSDAVSAPEFAKVVTDMDTMSRKLGYNGASVTELVYFINDIKPLVKSPTVARPGGFFSSIQGAVEGVLKAGAPNTKDQVEALKKILDKIDPTKAGITLAAAYIASEPETVEAFGDMIQDSPQFIDAFIGNLTDEKAVGALAAVGVLAVASKILSPATIAQTVKNTNKLASKLEKAGGQAAQVRDLKKTAYVLTKAREGNLEGSVKNLEQIMRRLEDEGLGKSIAFNNAYKARDVLYAELGGKTPDYLKNNKQSGMASFNEPLDRGKGKGGTPDATIKTKREVPMKDVAGNKLTVPEGVVISPSVNAKGQATITVNGKEYVVPKNQYDNLKNQSDISKATPFAPELDGMEVTVRTDTNPNGRSFNLDEQKTMATKYDQYTLPGGENYREILVRAPIGNKWKVMENPDASSERKWLIFDENNQRIHSTKTREEAEAFAGGGTKLGTYKSSHWEEPNVLFHLRMNDRTWNGKKVSFMEELQSDWARDGREKGFATNVNINSDDIDWKTISSGNLRASFDGKNYGINKEGNKFYIYEDGGVLGRTVNSLGEAKRAVADYIITQKANSVPNNPLLKNWQIPATKKALLDAVDRDADIFAWINGAQTSERYKLSTQVEKVNWNKDSMGNKGIILTPKENNTGGYLSFTIEDSGKIITTGNGVPGDWKGKRLDEVLGKGMADSIMSKQSGTLEGEGLNFGGEWAHNLYDKQVRDIVKKLTGAEVKQADMGLPLAKSNYDVFTFSDGNQVGGFVRQSDLREGLRLTDESGKELVVTEVLGDGDFKAVFSEYATSKKAREAALKYTVDSGKPQTATQQYIELTPEVKAKIKSEAPKFKMKNPSAGEALPLILLMLGGGAVATQQ